MGLQKCPPRVEIAGLAVLEVHPISGFSFAADSHFINYCSLTSGDSLHVTLHVACDVTNVAQSLPCGKKRSAYIHTVRWGGCYNARTATNEFLTDWNIVLQWFDRVARTIIVAANHSATLVFFTNTP